MQALIDVILPVFLVLGVGYLAVWRGFIDEQGIEGLMVFAQNFAVPCLLFTAMATLDLGASLNAPLLLAYYSAATVSFTVGLLGGRLLFGRPWEDSIAFGFSCLFTNSVLLGLPISERAYGSDSLGPNFAIIALHAPFCYVVGLTAMEVFRNRGEGASRTIMSILNAMVRNPFILAIATGLLFNLSGLATPIIIQDALDLMVQAALPAALFALGGVLVQYRPAGDIRAILYLCSVSLLLHPALVYAAGRTLGLAEGELRAAVVTAAMAPGVNSYLFANMYGVAQRVAASTVLIGTAACMFTAWIWLTILG